MKSSFLYITLISISNCLNAQIGFETHRIDSTALGAYAVFAGDADADGDMDLFSAALTEGVFGWYKNLGDGDFEGRQIINQGSFLARNIDGADLDGDGDMDMILVANDENKISWLENQDGLGTWGNETMISTESASPYTAKAFDLDDDGDLDILSASYGDDRIAWHENLDGQGTFGSRQIISSGANGASDAIAADLDQDGDLDVLSTSLLDNKTAWYENLDGLGTFSTENVLTRFSLLPKSVHAEDLDNDGDLDIYIAAQAAQNIVWWENLDGGATFSERLYIDIPGSNPSSVIRADLDNDGDLDFITAFLTGNKIEWYENLDGLLTFGTPQRITTDVNRPRSIIAMDLDNDGDIDIASASELDNKIQWYENLNLQSNALSGKVLFQVGDAPCTDDATPLPNIRVNTYSDTDTLSTFTIGSGYYKLYPGEGDFTTNLTTMLPDYYVPTPASFQSSFAGIGETNYQNFCITPVGTADDVNISIYPERSPRPGFVASYQVVIQNIGTAAVSADFTIAYDPAQMDYIFADLPIAAQGVDYLTFAYTDLLPLESRSMTIIFRVLPPPIVSIRDIVTLIATINPLTNDLTPEDNTAELQQTVVGSYDPNDITVLEGDQLLFEDKDNYLHYLIRFQNTGTADAIHVRVENTLDDNLDWTTFQPERLSHRNRIDITNGNDVVFNFEHINLPDSNANEAESHGYIMYKIKPKSSVELGDSIQNVGDIYFDFNPPITTNTVVTHITNAVATEEITPLEFTLYPNPAIDLLTVHVPTVIAVLTIYNQVGQMIHTTRNQKTFDVSYLNPGMYFCQITDQNGRVGIKKFIRIPKQE